MVGDDHDDPDEQPDVAEGQCWTRGSTVPPDVYQERTQAVVYFGYTEKLADLSFRFAPVSPWNSSIDHPNPWEAIPAFLEEFPGVAAERKAMAGYWGGSPSCSRYSAGGFFEGIRDTEKWIQGWCSLNNLPRAKNKLDVW